MEPILHWIIPTAILLAVFPRLDRKMVLLLSPLTWIPDIDAFIPGMHRILFYNVFFVVVAFLILYKFLGKTNAFIGLYFLASHILLDLSYPGVALLWPFVKNYYYFNVNINSNAGFIIDLNPGILSIEEGFRMTYDYMFTNGFLMIALVVAVLVAYYIIEKRKKK